MTYGYANRGRDHQKRIPDDALSIYDLLRILVANIVWREESEPIRLNKAIKVAEENSLFGNGGYFEL